MNIGGLYATKGSLGSWSRTITDGDVPALWTEFAFRTLNGPPERLSMWSMIDTGADFCVIPAMAIGVLLPEDGSPPHFGEGEIGARLNYAVTNIMGIGGTVQALSVRANIKLADKELPGLYRVAICNNLDYPLIGREVLNQFVGLYHPLGRRLLLSNCCCTEVVASCATKLAKSRTTG